MKTSFFLALAILSACTLQAQCVADSILKVHYDRDVKDLALQEIYKFAQGLTIPEITDSIDIPYEWQAPIWEGLSAIFNASDIPEWDTVFNIFCIHQTAYIGESALSSGVALKTSQSWMFSGPGMPFQTGNSSLDSLFSKYDFEFGYAQSDYLILNTAKAINMEAFVNKLMTFPEILDAQSINYIGDANRIIYDTSSFDQIKRIGFSLRWGDCFAGCIDARTWYFEVSPDCSVEYIGKYDEPGGGYPFPLPVYCNTFTQTNEPEQLEPWFEIFPNPISEEADLKIQLSERFVGEVKVEFLSIDGRMLRNETLKDFRNYARPVNNLPNQFIVRVSDEKRSLSRLVFKI